MRSIHLMSSSYLSLWCQMAACASQPASFLILGTRCRFCDFWRIDGRNSKRFGEMADVAGTAFFFNVARVNWERINTRDSVSGGSCTHVSRHIQLLLFRSTEDHAGVVNVSTESVLKFTIDRLMACAALFRWRYCARGLEGVVSGLNLLFAIVVAGDLVSDRLHAKLMPLARGNFYAGAGDLATPSIDHVIQVGVGLQGVRADEVVVVCVLQPKDQSCR